MEHYGMRTAPEHPCSRAVVVGSSAQVLGSFKCASTCSNDKQNGERTASLPPFAPDRVPLTKSRTPVHVRGACEPVGRTADMVLLLADTREGITMG